MNYLIDTHILLWMMLEPNKLSEKVKSVLVNYSNTIYVSQVSLWEMAVKIKIGKLDIKMSLTDIINKMNNHGILILPIKNNHIEETINLELHHRDPFDRLIIAQTRVENMTIISKDSNFSKYDVEILW